MLARTRCQSLAQAAARSARCQCVATWMDSRAMAEPPRGPLRGKTLEVIAPIEATEGSPDDRQLSAISKLLQTSDRDAERSGGGRCADVVFSDVARAVRQVRHETLRRATRKSGPVPHHHQGSASGPRGPLRCPGRSGRDRAGWRGGARLSLLAIVADGSDLLEQRASLVTARWPHPCDR